MAALSKPAHILPSSLKNAAVYEAEGLRWVASPQGAVQTAMELAAPTSLVLENHRAMMLASILSTSIRQILDLGLGGGALLRHLGASPASPQFTAVENDPHMLKVARQYFALEPSQAVHLDDAVDFLARNSAHYDLVLCDVFVGREAPAGLRQQAFYGDLARCLEKGGAAALNTLPASEDEVAEILRAVRPHFAGVGIVQFEAMGNLVLLLQREPLPDKPLLQESFAASVYAGDIAMVNALERLVVL